ncbi:hypothetical protein Scep_009318 [Stephania cephalantha]|uniref:Uncharacterized protein n=1 Tax=Stephania cephalantha TaxID=152367 RepID=A0AAP0JVD1_9MAGN
MVSSPPVLQFYTGEVHELMIQALDGDGKPRCIGGDYFETDLSSQSWKSRPPIKDFSNGSYSIKLQVHPRFPGLYNLTIVLLFRRFEGLKLSPERFAVQKQLLNLSINFINFNSSSSTLPQLHQCRRRDFTRQIWSGRWTRHARNDNCRIDRDGRFRCLDGDHKCEKTWCYGSLAAIESNGWVYSAHCSFMVFSQLQAWNCLHNRWIFFWGDSNHVDSIRNMLNFVLGLPQIKSVPRRFDTNFTNPFNPSQSVRITSIFNGHYNDSLNYQGLHSLQDKPYRDLISSYFSEPAAAPDTVVMNSGLHDGVHWRTVRAFAGGAEYAAKFWAELVESVRRRGLPAPVILYRSTVATGGYARKLAFNPQKMEAFNGILVEKLKNYGILGGFVDGFDMTFPWHFDNRCNDGVHYGRAPAKARWRDGEIGHQYFVDVMLGHVLLNAICAR